jgi:hypothetical protein
MAKKKTKLVKTVNLPKKVKTEDIQPPLPPKR